MGALSDKVDHDPIIFFFLPTESISWTDWSVDPKKTEGTLSLSVSPIPNPIAWEALKIQARVI